MTPVLSIKPLAFPWETKDPFLFCAFHEDIYPPGNDQLGPEPSWLQGRTLGQDFEIKDGFRMYHGTKVPGFPSHPHRGFETVTIAQKGLVDHSDSLGAAGRFGNGDVQWMTAGREVQHCEMFPLLNKEGTNPLLMFQIWLNLPREKKLTTPHFAMLWNEQIPKHHHQDTKGNQTEITVIAGILDGTIGLPPAPDSWASNPANEVCIWTIKMDPEAEWVLPAAGSDLNRSLYCYKGTSFHIADTGISNDHVVTLLSNERVKITNGQTESHFLFLQGKPINEPVAQYGPFVMNNDAEIQQTIREYQQTQFGGWPWPKTDHTHGANDGRFAKYADGRIEKK